MVPPTGVMPADDPRASKFRHGSNLCRSWSVNSNKLIDKLLNFYDIAAMGELQFPMLVHCDSMLVYYGGLQADSGVGQGGCNEL